MSWVKHNLSELDVLNLLLPKKNKIKILSNIILTVVERLNIIWPHNVYNSMSIVVSKNKIIKLSCFLNLKIQFYPELKVKEKKFKTFKSQLYLLNELKETILCGN